MTLSLWGCFVSAFFYAECSGPLAIPWFGAIFLFCNFVVINLFVAVFIENFELNDEVQQREKFLSLSLSLSHTHILSFALPLVSLVSLI